MVQRVVLKTLVVLCAYRARLVPIFRRFFIGNFNGRSNFLSDPCRSFDGASCVLGLGNVHDLSNREPFRAVLASEVTFRFVFVPSMRPVVVVQTIYSLNDASSMVIPSCVRYA